MSKSVSVLLALILAAALVLTGCAGGDSPQTVTEPQSIVIPDRTGNDKCTDMGTPLADVRIRQALACAIDMDTVIEALFYGQAQRAVSFLAPADDSGISSWDYDPDRAKALLAEAGWPSEYVLDVVYYHDDELTLDFLDVVGSYWDAVGIRAEFRKLEGDLASQLWSVPEDGNSAVEWDLAYGAVAALTELEFYDRFASDASNNSHTPAIDGLDALIAQARETRDESARQELLSQIQLLLAREISFLPLYHQNCFIYVSDHVDTADIRHGNDQFTYEKNILNWTTDREDETLYTDGGPEEFFSYPAVNPGLYLYQELVFERLLKSDGDLEPTGGQIAESYTYSDDGKTLEFVIPEGLTWHDGEPLMAEDVKFTFELYLRCPGANAVLTDVLEAICGADAFLAGDAEDCAGITVAENRVVFTFDTAMADTLKVFAQWPILPRHKLEDVAPEKLQQNRFWKAPIGSGPYRVGQVELGEFCILERWDAYRETGTGNVRYIHMRASGESDGSLVALTMLDQLDYAWGKSADDAVSVAEVDGMGVHEVDIPYTRCFFINQYPHESRIAGLTAEEPQE